MINPKYSVIIPVYNAEKTIHRCLDSLINQNYADMQIILVNDGSTDQSDNICRDYAARFSSIIFISKENGGVSSARNAGLDIATGKYLTFVDSDDYVSKDYFLQLDAILNESSADFIVFSYYKTDGIKTTTYIQSRYASFDKASYYCKTSELIYTKNINFPVNKVYRRSMIQKLNLRFHEGISIGEDRLFNIQYALACESLYLCNYPLYFVSTENEQSLSRRLRNDLQEQFQKLDDAIDKAVERANLEPEYYQQIQAALTFDVIRSVFSDTKRMHLSGASLAERRKFIRSKCRELNAKKLSVPKSRFCMMISLPVRLRMVTLIDMVGWKLAR